MHFFIWDDSAIFIIQHFLNMKYSIYVSKNKSIAFKCLNISFTYNLFTVLFIISSFWLTFVTFTGYTKGMNKSKYIYKIELTLLYANPSYEDVCICTQTYWLILPVYANQTMCPKSW